MPNPSQIIVLVEDSLHKQFIYRYLQTIGFNRHAVRIQKSPSGAGSGEQWVRERFPIEVQACRTRSAATRLIVLMDADTGTVQQRIAQLDQVLQQADMPRIDDGRDQIARLIPKRNIETWLLCLNNVPVNEETDYKSTRNDWPGLIRCAADTLYGWTRRNASISPVCVESLRLGILELLACGTTNVH